MDNIKVLNALKEYKNFATLSDFARFLGVKPQALSNWYARNTFDIHILSDKFPEVDGNWLISGEGSMLRDVSQSVTADPVSSVAVTQPSPNRHVADTSGTPRQHLPLIPIDAVAGFNGIDSPGVRLVDCALYEVPDFAEVHAEFLVRVSGSSMYPKYSSGDILACRKVPEITFIQWGKIYVIDSNQGAMVKRLFEIEGENDVLLCKSDNPNYPPFRLPKSEIRSLSVVVGAIRLE